MGSAIITIIIIITPTPHSFGCAHALSSSIGTATLVGFGLLNYR